MKMPSFPMFSSHTPRIVGGSHRPGGGVGVGAVQNHGTDVLRHAPAGSALLSVIRLHENLQVNCRGRDDIRRAITAPPGGGSEVGPDPAYAHAHAHTRTKFGARFPQDLLAHFVCFVCVCVFELCVCIWCVCVCACVFCV